MSLSFYEFSENFCSAILSSPKGINQILPYFMHLSPTAKRNSLQEIFGSRASIIGIVTGYGLHDMKFNYRQGRVVFIFQNA
jgi:hypothetical protein